MTTPELIHKNKLFLFENISKKRAIGEYNFRPNKFSQVARFLIMFLMILKRIIVKYDISHVN